MSGGTSATQVRNSELVDILSTDFQRRYEAAFAWGNAISLFQMLPGLRGFWPMSSSAGGSAFDLSGQGRTLSGSNVVFSRSGLVPRGAFASVSSAYLYRADEAGLDILGNEADIDPNYQGITLGGWFVFSTLGADVGLMSKYVVSGNQRAYLLRKTAADALTMNVSTDGTALVTGGTTTATQNVWTFVAGRFDPSATIDCFVNNVKTGTAAGVPATAYNASAAFEIGRYNAANYLNGAASLCFLCAAALPDAIIYALYEHTRALFGK